MEHKKILVVDDEHEVAALVAKNLEVKGFKVMQALSGREAVSKAKMFLPDLILLDIILPDMDGSEVVQKLRRNDATRSIAVIFLSGIVSQDEEDPESEVRVGGEPYPALPKPFSVQQLLDKIDRVLTNFS